MTIDRFLWASHLESRVPEAPFGHAAGEQRQDAPAGRGLPLCGGAENGGAVGANFFCLRQQTKPQNKVLLVLFWKVFAF